MGLVMEHFEDRWWEPGPLAEAAQAIRRSTPSDEFFCDSTYQPVREAIAVAELKCGNDVRLFEVVEADREDRRRCQEYRAAKGELAQVEHYDPYEEVRTALGEILRVVRLKAAKQYSPNPNLLVYVNLSAGEPTSLYAWKLAQEFEERFHSAWLLWQSGTFRLWPNAAKIKCSKY